MKRSSILFLAAILGAAALAPQWASAVTIVKDNNATALNLAGSWVGGVVPVNGDIAHWNSTVVAANTVALGASQEWDGILITNPGGAVTISNTADVLTLSPTTSTDGIDLSTATQNLTIGTSIVASAAQTWNVNTGRTLNLWTVNTSRGLSGSGNVSIAGAGTVNMLPGPNGSVGFNDAGSNNTYSGNWDIGGTATVTNLRNGATAWGTGTINLSGGTVGQVQGNWTWTNNIALTTATTSTLNDFNTSGTTRSLKLQGVISGTGNVTFNDTSNRMGNDTGYILTGTNTLSGAITLGASADVRIGGVPGNDTTTGVGSGGTIGTATVNLSAATSTLTLSRNNTWTFANDVSGPGVLRVGLTSGSATHIVTVTGNNTHSGGTRLQTQVTLNVGSSNALGTGAFTIGGNGIFDNTTGGALVLANAFTMSGGSPTFTGTNDMTFNGAGLISGANRTVTVNGGTLTLGGALGQDIAGRNFTKQGAGTLVLGGANTYSGTTSVNAGTLLLNGSHATGAAYTVAAGATLGGIGSTASAVTVTGTVAPGTSIGTLGVGATGLDGTYLLETAAGSLSDLLNVSGALTLGAASILDLVGGSLVAGETYTIASYQSLSGTFLTVDPAITATHLVDYLTGNQIRLVPVPEPGTFAMLLFGAASFWAVGRKRRK